MNKPAGYPVGLMPRQSNISAPTSDDWLLTTCPQCGAKCWYQTDNAEMLRQLYPDVQFLCTECALGKK